MKNQINKKTRFLTILILLSTFVTLPFSTIAQTWPPSGMQGDGTEANPWQIATEQHLGALATYIYYSGSTIGQHYKLMNNLDLSDYPNWYPIGGSTPFRGTFDGNGKVIQNLLRRLFGLIDNATIKNLGIENCNITDGGGGLVGGTQSGAMSTISNCYVTGKITGESTAGGLIGFATNVSVSNCYTTCDVSGNNNVGGLIGNMAAGGQLSYCYATGTVKGTGNYIGGLVGYFSGGYETFIENCVAANDSVITTSNTNYINRIIGFLQSSYPYPQNCYALNTMIVKNSNGIVNVDGSPEAGTAKPIETLQSLSFYTTSSNWNGGAWDIINPSGIWKMCDGQGLPLLRWQGIECPIITTANLPNGFTGTTYSQTLTATGTQPIIWSVINGNLPDNLILSTAGVISGTPTATGTFNFTVRATNSAGNDTKPLSIMISDVIPTITTTVLPDGTIDVAYNQQLSATGTQPITWSVINGSLPTNLTLSTAGVISGTPTVGGTFNFTVQATNSVGNDTKSLSITIPAPPVITTTTLSSGTVGTAYNQTLTATGTQPITWWVIDGNLPTSLTLSTSGIISGTPTTVGTFNFTVQASNDIGYAHKLLSITINGVAPIITTTTLPNGTIDVAYSQTLTATGTQPITWSVISGSLPTNLTLSTAGVISGTPTTVGTFNFTVQASNSAGNTTKALSITINGVTPVITTTTLPGGIVGTTYNTQLAATGTAPITWTLENGNLPNGLTLSSAGLISGIPTVAGTSNLTVKASNSAGSDTKALSIIISAAIIAPVITTTILPDGLVGSAYNQTLTATGTVPITWSLESGSLPNGLTLSAVGEISGIPTAAGVSNFTVKATNSAGSDTKPLSITVTTSVIVPTITTTILPDGKTGTEYSAQLEATGTAPIAWSLVSGNLPTGLTLYSGGTISGIPTIIGTFNFTVQATNSAGNDTKTLSIRIENGVGVSENEIENISIYPNPTTGELTIENGELKIDEVNIFDIYGKNVLSNHLITSSSHHLINISHLSAGVYFVKIRTEVGEVIKKVVKE